jgi:hypothetical protein
VRAGNERLGMKVGGDSRRIDIICRGQLHRAV